MFSAIIQRLTGATLLEYLRPRLLDPLGIDQASWETCPRGINAGGFGLSITTDAIARFGQLYLQNGVWNGQQLVPADWVAAATARQVQNGPSENIDWVQGYGYQFWRCRHGAYRGDGAFGQFCVVMPEQDAVLAITSGVGPMQPVLDLAWQHILPALGPAPLPADPAANAALSRKLGRLALTLPEGDLSAPAGLDLPDGTYVFEPNQLGFQAISFAFGPAGCELKLRDARGEHRLAAGYGAWRNGITTLVERGASEQPFVGAGTWAGADTYHAKFYYNETPFCVTMTCRLERERLLFDFGMNVSFGPTEFPRLVGRLG